MPRDERPTDQRPADKRQRLTTAALELSHRVGLSNAPLAAIAERADVPVGNVYYYFKTKDDLAVAVIDQRRREYADLRDTWDATSDSPRERLVAFVRHTRDTSGDLTENGCPIGGLCTDLANTNPTLANRAGAIFADTIDWANDQYRAAGHPEPSAAATRLVAVLQGATVLAHSARSANILTAECDRLEHDIRAGIVRS